MTSHTQTPSALHLHHVFGLKGDVKDNMQYVDESEVVYPSGRSILSYNMEKKTQRFIQTEASGGNNRMTAMALSTSKVKYLAVAETAEKAQIWVYEVATHKRKTKVPLTCPEMASREWVSLSFSPDGKQLLAQGGAPDWTLVNFQWEKGKPLQMAQVSNQTGAAVYQCSYCPMDPTCVCVTGHGILRFLRLEQSEFKSIQFNIGKREPQNYLCHAWLDDRVLVATDSGDILLFENGDFHGVLPSSPGNGKSIDSIAAYSKGFVCGCDEGVLHVFERDEKEVYKRSKSFQIESNLVRIKNLAISPSEDNVACTLENNQAFVFSLSNTDILKAEDMNFEPLAVSFHVGTITGLDVCVRKPLMITCGVDRSVRVWNYAERTLELVKYFKEEPHTVAFHPSGLHLLVGFGDCLAFLNLLMDEMRVFKEFPVKNCKEVRFSNGGQYFAAANGTVVQLYATYSCEVIGNLRGHKAKIHSLYWSHDDSSIISADAEGQIFEWRLKEGVHVQEFTVQRAEVTCAVGTQDGVMLAVSNDQTLRMIEQSKERYKIDCGVFLTQLILPGMPQNYLFAATETGSVRAYELPLNGSFTEFECHGAPVTRIRISPDENFLFTVSEDGCLAIFELDQKDARNAARRRHELMLPWAEEILVTKADLEKKVQLVQELRNRVEELQQHNQMQLKVRENNYQEKLKDITAKFNRELEADKMRYSALEDGKAEMERKYTETLNEMEARHRAKVSNLEQYQAQKLRIEEQRLQQLEASLKTSRERWAEQKRRRDDIYRQELMELDKELQRQIATETQQKMSLSSQKDSLVGDFEETKNIMEEDADNDIDEIKSAYDAKLTAERMNTLRLQDENAILKKKFSTLNDDIKEQKENIRKREVRQRALYDQIRNLEKDVEGHMKEIQERESTIADKVKRIFELRKKNQELEKFKFVLDYKIKELKRQIAPRQNEIKDMDEQITQMNSELATYKKDNAYLQLHVKELKLKLNGLEKETAAQEAQRVALLALLRRMRCDVSGLQQHFDFPKALKEAVKGLYYDAMNRDISAILLAARSEQESDASNGALVTTTKSTHDQSDAQVSYQRQRNYLERSIDSLRSKLDKELQVYKKDHTRITQENIALVSEINTLRREMQMMKNGHALSRDVDPRKRTERKQQPLQLQSSDALNNSRQLVPVGSRANQEQSLVLSSTNASYRENQKALIENQQQQISYLRQQLNALKQIHGPLASPPSSSVPLLTATPAPFSRRPGSPTSPRRAPVPPSDPIGLMGSTAVFSNRMRTAESRTSRASYTVRSRSTSRATSGLRRTPGPYSPSSNTYAQDLAAADGIVAAAAIASAEAEMNAAAAYAEAEREIVSLPMPEPIDIIPSKAIEDRDSDYDTDRAE